MQQFHVNGLATLQANFGDGLTSVGYSTDGVTIELHFETDDIHTDKWGSKMPEDIMDLGQWATVKMQLIKYDTTAIQELENRLNSTTAPGKQPNVDGSGNILIGTLMGQCNAMTPIAITRGQNVGCEGTPLEGGWQFGAAYLADMDSFKVGTRVTVHDLTFRCLPDASGILFSVIASS
jgi:hypothetical protein